MFFLFQLLVVEDALLLLILGIAHSGVKVEEVLFGLVEIEEGTASRRMARRRFGGKRVEIRALMLRDEIDAGGDNRA